MLRRKAHFLPVVVAAAALASGCLSSTTDYGPDPGQADPGQTSNNGDRPNNPDPGSGGTTPTAMPDLGGPPAAQGTIKLMLPSTSDSIRLNETKEYDVMVLPSSDFSGGTVVYSVEGLPANVTATFTPPGGMITTTATTTKLALKTTGDAVPAAGKALTLKATSGTIIGSTALTLDILAELLVTIPKGVDIGTAAAPNLVAFGAQSIPTVFVAPGTKVTFVNADTINHQIHSDGNLGIAHEGGPLQANAVGTYTQTFNAAGTFNFRCHIHPNMKGQIVVKTLPAQ